MGAYLATWDDMGGATGGRYPWGGSANAPRHGHVRRPHARFRAPKEESARVPEELDQLVADAKAASLLAGQASGAAPRAGIAKVRYTHEALIDMIVTNPWISQDSLAAYFGYSASWISTIINSDAFQAALHKRKMELVDPALKEQIDQTFDILIRRSQEILMARLQSPEVSDNTALRTLELASRSRGYGARQEPLTPPGDVHIHLENMKGNLIGLLRREKSAAGLTIDVLPELT